MASSVSGYNATAGPSASGVAILKTKRRKLGKPFRELNNGEPTHGNSWLVDEYPF
jgi:hypothetical protein